MPKIKNIIFDLGGVIFDLNYQRTEEAFIKLGAKNFGSSYSKLKQNSVFDDFERGMVSTEEFRKNLSRLLNIHATDEEFDNAWSAMLLGWSKEKLEFATSLNKDYQIFILSNTNDIHYPRVFDLLQKDIGLDSLDSLFDKTYYSNKIKMRKPDAEIFNLVLEENYLLATETLFVDDSPQNIQGANNINLNSFHINESKTIHDIISVLN